MDTRSHLEARKRTLLSHVERALLDALAESPEVHRSIWRLQRAGFTLRLSIECHEAQGGESAEESSENASETSSVSAVGPPGRARSGRSSAAPPDTALAPPAATFRIDADDLGFLRSIGIDPTRRPRPRRRA